MIESTYRAFSLDAPAPVLAKTAVDLRLGVRIRWSDKLAAQTSDNLRIEVTRTVGTFKKCDWGDFKSQEQRIADYIPGNLIAAEVILSNHLTSWHIMLPPVRTGQTTSPRIKQLEKVIVGMPGLFHLVRASLEGGSTMNFARSCSASQGMAFLCSRGAQMMNLRSRSQPRPQTALRPAVDRSCANASSTKSVRLEPLERLIACTPRPRPMACASFEVGSDAAFRKRLHEIPENWL